MSHYPGATGQPITFDPPESGEDDYWVACYEDLDEPSGGYYEAITRFGVIFGHTEDEAHRYLEELTEEISPDPHDWAFMGLPTVAEFVQDLIKLSALSSAAC